jgi:hypothetical protein
MCMTWTQKMPRHDKVKINWANGQTRGKKLQQDFCIGYMPTDCPHFVLTMSLWCAFADQLNHIV